MIEMKLTSEQSNLILSSKDNITLRSSSGDYLGMIDCSELAVIAEAKRRMPLRGPTIPHDAMTKLLAELQSELDRTGHVDPAVVRARFKSLRAQASHD